LLELSSNCLDKLSSKNLFAFSGGVDSSFLFFLLLDNGIEFDLAIVNYNTRDSSHNEISYAKHLATKYNKQVHILDTYLSTKSNFEAKARTIRYDFFENLISKFKYKNLITAHQLNDRLEWFLMQFIKGAGLSELIGANEISEKDDYFKIRPILHIDRIKIMDYLKKNKIKFFNDESNDDEKYTRNKIRKTFSNELISKYSKGIKNSFDYLDIDKKSLFKINILYQEKSLYIIQRNQDKNIEIRDIDLIAKRLGVLMSASTKAQIINQNECDISYKDKKVSIGKDEELIFIAPKDKAVIPKKIREKYRISKIPPNLRAYFYNKDIKWKDLQ